MNSALRLRSLPVRVLRRRYGALATTLSHQQPSVVAPVVRRQQWAATNLSTMSSRRYLHSTVVLLKDYPDHQVLAMPALSPTMESGTIAKWELSEGDSFTAGSVFCTIETDKATMDFESQDDGFLAKILKEGPAGVDIPIGSPIGIAVEDEADVAAFADFVLEEEQAPVASSAPAAATPVAAASPAGRAVSDEHVLLPSARFLAESKYVFTIAISVCLTAE